MRSEQLRCQDLNVGMLSCLQHCLDFFVNDGPISLILRQKNIIMYYYIIILIIKLIIK